MPKNLLTKHGKYYELNPYKIIQRLEEINDLLYYTDNKLAKKVQKEVDGLIDDMYEQGQLPR